MFSNVIISYFSLDNDIKISLFNGSYYIFQVPHHEQLCCTVTDVTHVTLSSFDRSRTPSRMFLQCRYPVQEHQCVSKSLNIDIVITSVHRIFLKDVKLLVRKI